MLIKRPVLPLQVHGSFSRETRIQLSYVNIRTKKPVAESLRQDVFISPRTLALKETHGPPSFLTSEGEGRGGGRGGRDRPARPSGVRPPDELYAAAKKKTQKKQVKVHVTRPTLILLSMSFFLSDLQQNLHSRASTLTRAFPQTYQHSLMPDPQYFFLLAVLVSACPRVGGQGRGATKALRCPRLRVGSCRCCSGFGCSWVTNKRSITGEIRWCC